MLHATSRVRGRFECVRWRNKSGNCCASGKRHSLASAASAAVAAAPAAVIVLSVAATAALAPSEAASGSATAPHSACSAPSCSNAWASASSRATRLDCGRQVRALTISASLSQKGSQLKVGLRCASASGAIVSALHDTRAR